MRMSKFVIAAGAAMIAAPMASAQETVKIGDFTWTGSDAIGHVIAAVINGPFGSEAVIVEGLSMVTSLPRYAQGRWLSGRVP